MKFAFIHAEKACFPVTALCRLLGVTRQGYYAYASRPPSERLKRERALQQRVQQVHAESRGTYGSPRVLATLKQRGEAASKRRVERALRSLGLRGRTPRRWRSTTRANPLHPVVGNVLDRDFTASRPNERWVTDITYIWTDGGWCYLAAILDLFSRTVVGWALDSTLSTSLPLAALDMAVRRRFATLKAELIHGRTWPTRLELRAAVFEYIEVFYNRRRLHSSVAYRTPAQVETDFALANAA